MLQRRREHTARGSSRRVDQVREGGEGPSEEGTLQVRYKNKLGLTGRYREGRAFLAEGTASESPAGI